ncbi:PAS domain S-box protein [Sulfurimonas sp. MAG313]|nr:PAS domain S-box protein [Sulfurimonas sp. MAG313]MDF1880729.1 PAS domain S-box protein [Sulfurimonas sp. MAG313]
MPRKIDPIIFVVSFVFVVFISSIYYLTYQDKQADNFSSYQENFEKLTLLDTKFENFLMRSLYFNNYDTITTNLEGFDQTLLKLEASSISNEFDSSFGAILVELRHKFQLEQDLLEYHKSLNSVSVNSIHYLFDLRSTINNSDTLKEKQKLLIDELLFSLMQLFTGIQPNQITLQNKTRQVKNYALSLNNDYLINFYTQAVLLQKNMSILLTSVDEHKEIQLIQDITNSINLLQISYQKQIDSYQYLNVFLAFITFILLLILILLHLKSLKIAQENLSFRFAVENSDNFIIMTDTKRKITYVNESFQKNTGFSKEDVLGRSPNLLKSNQTKKSTFVQMESSLQAQKTWKGEFINKRKDGSIFYVASSIIPIIIKGELHSYLSIGLDITKHIKQKEELQEAKLELETKVHIRTLELREKADALEETLANLKDFQKQLVETEKMSALGSLVAGVAHEINTPVGVSLTAITYIQQETQTLFKSIEEGNLRKTALNEYVSSVTAMSDSIYISLQTAIKLVRSFKQVAIDQHTEEKRIFNLKEYCDEVILSLHSKFRTEQVKVHNHIDENIHINSYAGIYSQIFTNFILNSLLHAFDKDIENKTIKIRGFIEEEYLHLIYEDNGRGIDKKHIDKIFNPFFTTKLGQGGSGLGLHIVYNLIHHKLQGDIICTNTTPGVKMQIYIPMSELTYKKSISA